MIDIEADVFDAVARAVWAKWPDAYVTNESDMAPPSFPCVEVVEQDNSVIAAHQDSARVENAAAVTYAVNIYSNRRDGRRAEAKSIAKAVDECFAGLGFRRQMMQPVDNAADASVVRYLGRWQAAVTRDGVVRRR